MSVGTGIEILASSLLIYFTNTLPPSLSPPPPPHHSVIISKRAAAVEVIISLFVRVNKDFCCWLCYDRISKLPIQFHATSALQILRYLGHRDRHKNLLSFYHHSPVVPKPINVNTWLNSAKESDLICCIF